MRGGERQANDSPSTLCLRVGEGGRGGGDQAEVCSHAMKPTNGGTSHQHEHKSHSGGWVALVSCLGDTISIFKAFAHESVRAPWW